MKKHTINQPYLRIGLVALLMVCSGYIPMAHAAAPDSAFYPMMKDDSWEYTTIDKQDNNAEFPMKVVITGPWTEDSKSGMIMTQKDKRGTMRQFMLVNAQGAFMEKLGLSKSFTPEVFSVFTPPVPCLIFPLTPGTKVHWEGRLKVAWVNQVIIFDGTVVGWEDLTVPAGSFHCIKVHFHETRDGKVTDEDAWYAAGVGQVKYDGGQYTKVLKSYTVDPSEKVSGN